VLQSTGRIIKGGEGPLGPRSGGDKLS